MGRKETVGKGVRTRPGKENINRFPGNEIENSALRLLSPDNVYVRNEKVLNEQHLNFHIPEQIHFQ